MPADEIELSFPHHWRSDIKPPIIRKERKTVLLRFSASPMHILKLTYHDIQGRFPVSLPPKKEQTRKSFVRAGEYLPVCQKQR